MATRKNLDVSFEFELSLPANDIKVPCQINDNKNPISLLS